MFVGIWGYSFLKEKYTQEINKKYEQETKDMSKNDLKIINKVISLAKGREGQEYTWGGKGEIITKERLEELIGYYGESYYPLENKDYIGKQGFDCSGLTYWAYKIVTNINIGYSTTEQKYVLKDYKVQMENIQPGDLIFTPGHVVMYIGRGKIINSANRNPYPIGGIKIESILRYNNGYVYRPIDYINSYLK
ncbi:C40 family peptidase [Terrisporobacter petrolearius]|uniref:C40 family peptidase n=1 Tax=Terrisporobacter petrolearius TaxID=1460447 RepID=UPI001D16C3B7|nr:NlpC/P60 family protein [Terrisporobacter petrolearius]